MDGEKAMSYADMYVKVIQNKIQQVMQQEAIEKAAEIIIDSYENDGMLHVFGTGHSHMMALEMFYRAGGLVKVNPILDEGLMLHNSASSSTQIERLEGYGRILFEQNTIRTKDVMIICSNSGINAVPVEMAQLCQKKDVKVIALTNKKQSIQERSRAKSGKKLYECADVIIDNECEIGDACMNIAHTGYKMGPTSSIIGMIVLNSIAMMVVEKIYTKGGRIEVFTSSNITGGEKLNQGYLDKYKGKIRSL